ncbi:MAG: hypothetical protein OEY72_00660, partial [Gammaproteobacteria bacterium]|nr:hypothetical protein [Gammaproteobacteria bacterium]
MPSTGELRQSDPVSGRAPDTTPCIDARELLSADPVVRRNLVEQAGKTCHEFSFFYLTHAFDHSPVAANAFRQMQTFFTLPDNDPRKIAVDNRNKYGSYGWMPMFGEPAYQPGTVAHVESFDCGLEGGPGAGKDLEGQNVWPDLPQFREDVCELWNSLAALGAAMLEVLAEIAGLDKSFFRSRCNSHELSTLRLLHYPGGPAPDALRDVGIAAHTDFECISLILQTAPGLELTDVNGRWLDTPARSDQVIVLLDDMLERWTNGFFRATGHRVRRTATPRYSVVLFNAVNAGLTVCPLQQFV